ncbi:MAG: DNA-binding protein [Azoarcus sp.]|nr:DNA-binding protein [Azoarcus sp.]
MRTVIESPVFQKQAAAVWSEEDYLDFTFWISSHPDAGEVIRETDPPARKVRWKRTGSGKSAGVRVIYYYLAEDGAILLLTVYAKAARETLKASQINKLAKK